MIFEFYEGKNVVQSNVYNNFLYITDPFYMPTGSALRHKYKMLSKRILKGISIIDKSPAKLVHRYDNYKPPYFISIEFKILDHVLLDDIKNHKGYFVIDRYIVECESKKYFLKRYNEGILHRIEGDLVIFFLKSYDMIYEYDLIEWKRDIILNQLI